MIEDGDRVTLGGMTLRAFWTGGHTQGATMWMTTVQEGGNTYPSRSVEARFQTPELRFNNPRHPTVVADTQRTLRRLKDLEAPDPLPPQSSAEPGSCAEPGTTGQLAVRLLPRRRRMEGDGTRRSQLPNDAP